MWHAPSTDNLGVDLDQAAAHEHTSMLGVLMYANVRERRGQPLHIVTARPGNSGEMNALFRTIRSLAAARMLQGRTVLRIGEPYPGYLNIAAEAAQLAQLGLVEREISVSELEEAYDAVDAAEVEAVTTEVSGHGWKGKPDERGLRVAVAMRQLAKHFDAVCGAINCHVSSAATTVSECPAA